MASDIKDADAMFDLLARSASVGSDIDGAEMIAERAGTTSIELAKVAVALAQGMDLDESAASDIFVGIQAGIMLMNEVD